MTEDRATNATPSELVSAVAHELQAPIAAVRASTAALRAEHRLDPETRERLLAVIANAADQLGRLADDLLFAGQVRGGAFRVDLVPCDAVEVVTKVIDAARAAAPTGEVTLVLSPAGLPLVLADPGRLGQVATNLVGNAQQHGPPGAPVEVRLEESGGFAQLTVTDHGPGIPAQEQALIFERFQRGTTAASAGSGLGLYIVRELVTAMRGDVRVESEQGISTSFVVRLPLA